MNCWSQKTVQDVRKLRSKGLPSSVISQKLDIPQKAVHYLINKYMPELNTKEIKSKIYSSSAHEAHVNGGKLRKERFKKSMKKAYKRGCYEQAWEKNKKPFTLEQIQKAYVTGDSIKILAKKLGCHYTHLSQILILYPDFLEKIQTNRVSKPDGITNRIGDFNPTIRKDGYVRYRIGKYYRGTKDGRILAHKYIAETILDRPLVQPELVHHINGNKSDNRPENLLVCPSEKEHRILHRRMEIELFKLFPEECEKITKRLLKDSIFEDCKRLG